MGGHRIRMGGRGTTGLQAGDGPETTCYRITLPRLSFATYLITKLSVGLILAEIHDYDQFSVPLRT